MSEWSINVCVCVCDVGEGEVRPVTAGKDVG